MFFKWLRHQNNTPKENAWPCGMTDEAYHAFELNQREIRSCSYLQDTMNSIKSKTMPNKQEYTPAMQENIDKAVKKKNYEFLYDVFGIDDYSDDSPEQIGCTHLEGYGVFVPEWHSKNATLINKLCKRHRKERHEYPFNNWKRSCLANKDRDLVCDGKKYVHLLKQSVTRIWFDGNAQPIDVLGTPSKVKKRVASTKPLLWSISTAVGTKTEILGSCRMSSVGISPNWLGNFCYDRYASQWASHHYMISSSQKKSIVKYEPLLVKGKIVCHTINEDIDYEPQIK